jgi:hypothetical protein
MDLCLTIRHLYAKPVLPEELSKSEQWLPRVTVRDKLIAGPLRPAPSLGMDAIWQLALAMPVPVAAFRPVVSVFRSRQTRLSAKGKQRNAEYHEDNRTGQWHFKQPQSIINAESRTRVLGEHLPEGQVLVLAEENAGHHILRVLRSKGGGMWTAWEQHTDPATLLS